MQEKWISVLHHICGEHSWAGGKCEHENLATTEPEPKTYLKKDSPAMEAVRSVVLDPKVLRSLEFYTRFR